MTNQTLKPWEPSQVLITQDEVNASLEYAAFKQWSFCPSPINAAFVTMLAIKNLLNEN